MKHPYKIVGCFIIALIAIVFLLDYILDLIF